MFLNYLQIMNYKNLRKCRFSFVEGVNTIIGENDSGKSNAMTALRILLDDTYYYNTKRLKENDFSDSLINWKGHWIIISAIFGDITSEDQKTEVCAEIVPETENEDFLKSYIKSGSDNIGVISLFIRPQKSVRKKLHDIQDAEEFQKERNKIKLADYEFYFTSRSQTDFTDDDVYNSIVGDLDHGKCSDPEDDDDSILGSKLNISDVQDHISVVFIDALRDVASELNKPKNPIRRIVESIESYIHESEIDEIKKEISQLNKSISEVEQIELVGKKINKKLLDLIGMVYSPEIILESGLKDDINSLSRYLFMKSSKQDDIESLGLGHLNMIYMALKIIEFEVNRTRELLNIMIIEEPEAHIHAHIQRTLFDKLKVTKDYTQIIATTHSTYLSEVSDIRKVNILKCKDNATITMQPSNNLDRFGQIRLHMGNLSLSECVERYLDAKRSVLLFSKGVILVEGDGEEILIPNLIKKAFGIALDELGIGLVNVGSTAFEYLASLFSNKRIQRYCSIVTDEDVQIVEKSSSFYKGEAESRGKSRKAKLEDLYKENPWVESFYAPHTLEVDFALCENKNNSKYIENIVEINYVKQDTIQNHKDKLIGSDSECANTVLTLARDMGKGWYAIILSNNLDCAVSIPEYILDAVAFACQEVINIDIVLKIIEYSLTGYEDKDSKPVNKLLQVAKTLDEKRECIHVFREAFPSDVVTQFCTQLEKYCESWCN